MDFYKPNMVDGGIRVQDANNKQHSVRTEPSLEVLTLFEEANVDLERQLARYHRMLELGVPRETARLYLPNSQYTRLFITIDLHNFLGLCFLRADFEHAQWETAMFTQAMIDLVRPLFPVVLRCFDNRVGGISLSKDELSIIHDEQEIDKLPVRERSAIRQKKQMLQLSVL